MSESKVEREVNWKAFGFLGACIVFPIVLWIIFSASGSSRGTLSSNGKDSLGFSGEQNDHVGYGGYQWGLPTANLDPPFDPEANATFVDREYGKGGGDQSELASVFEVPVSNLGTGLLEYQGRDFSVVPKKFQTFEKEGCKYIFYEGHLAMAYVELHANDYDRVLSDLGKKFQQVAVSTDEWTQQTLESDPDTTTLTATLFKRGTTNTRIYLLNREDHATGMGIKIVSVHLLYVPTAYMWAIQLDMQGLLDAKKTASLKSAQEAAQPDLDKVQ